jgi:hypothetical protein
MVKAWTASPCSFIQAGVTPGSANHLASTTTANGGRYLFSHLPAGQYVVHVAADNFKAFVPNATGTAGPGPLHTFISRPGSGSTGSSSDDDVDENGIDNANPELAGISSNVITIAPGTAPLVIGSETGAFPEMNAVHGDANVDLTVDFAFIASAPGSANAERTSNTLGATDSSTDAADEEDPTVLSPATYLAWAQQYELGSLAAPEQDADADGLSNLLEYALGLDPLNGFDQRPALQLLHDPATGLISALTTRPASGLQDLRFAVQTRTDLAATAPGWQTLASTPLVSVNSDGTQTLRYPDLASLTTADSGFVRLVVQLDADGNGNAEATATSAVAGFLRRSFHLGQQTFSHALLNRPVYSGRAHLTSPNTLNLELANGQDIASALEAQSDYYVEVITGAAVGHRFEVDASASQGSTLALRLDAEASTTSQLPADLHGARIHLRAHHSLSSLLPAASLTSAATASQADRALFFDRSTNQFQVTWAQAGSPASWSSDTGTANRRIVAPGEAFLLHLRQQSLNTVWTGWVRENDFRLKLQAGSQLIGPGYPVAHSPTTFGFASPAFTASSAPSEADRFRLWLGDSQPNSTGYRFHFLLSAETPDQAPRWVDQTDGTLQDVTALPLFPVGSGLFFQRLNASPTIAPQQPAP